MSKVVFSRLQFPKHFFEKDCRVCQTVHDAMTDADISFSHRKKFETSVTTTDSENIYTLSEGFEPLLKGQ